MALLVAVSENDVIGNANRLPWHLPADLRFFKSTTMGKPILMGRKTFESIGKALPGRRNLAMTRDGSFSAPGVEVVSSVAETLALVGAVPELIVIGGAEIFRLWFERATRIYLTRVHAVVAGDTRFPKCDWSEWRLVARSTHPADEKNAYSMTFTTLERSSSR